MLIAARLMLDRNEGLTKTYNRVHDPGEKADDVVRLRELHVELDYASATRTAGVTSISVTTFTRRSSAPRFTFAPVPRQEVLDRLLELNHERYAEEVRKGLHGKAKGKAKSQGGAEPGR